VNPTQYSDINSLLQELLSGVRAILADQFVGLYLYGSLSSGDFDQDRSDVDFVVVTNEEVSESAFQQLALMHSHLAAGGSKWAKKLEGAYIPQHSLRRHDRADAPHPFLNEGVFRIETLTSDWIIQRFVIREQGIVVAGPDPKTLIDPIQPPDLQNAVRGVLRQWWLPQLQQPSRLHERGYQAYAVLTMCRALYTLRHGAIASKPVSAEWTRKSLDLQWKGLIERAAAALPGDGVNDIDETLSFIRYTLAQAL
jgi:hypothetical protein